MARTVSKHAKTHVAPIPADDFLAEHFARFALRPWHQPLRLMSRLLNEGLK